MAWCVLVLLNWCGCFCFLKVEIKRTIPKGSMGSKDFKTRKIFVGGIPSTVNDGDSLLRFMFLNVEVLFVCRYLSGFVLILGR